MGRILCNFSSSSWAHALLDGESRKTVKSMNSSCCRAMGAKLSSRHRATFANKSGISLDIIGAVMAILAPRLGIFPLDLPSMAELEGYYLICCPM